MADLLVILLLFIITWLQVRALRRLVEMLRQQQIEIGQRFCPNPKCGSRHYLIRPKGEFAQGLIPIRIQIFDFECLDCGSQWKLVEFKSLGSSD